MATSSSVDGLRTSSLQKEAIEKARLSFSRLPRGDAIFQQCIDQAVSIPDIVKSVIQTSHSYKERKSTPLLQQFEQHTQFLQNASDVIDIVVQTQAGIGCAVWAPIKFVLQVSKDHAQAAEQVLNLIEVISESHPRFEIYGKLPPDPILQRALLNIFTDVVEFSVRTFQFFRRSAPARVTRLLVRPFREEFGDIFDRLKRRTENVDLTAMATQLLHASESRKEERKFRFQSWLEPPNFREFHQDQVDTKLPGTCDWIKGNPAFVKWNEPSSLPACSQLLCISGTHGCGKSILASSIIEDPKSRQLHTTFFYFSGEKGNLKNLNAIVRALLWQFLDGTTDQRNLELIRGLVLKGPPAVIDMIYVLTEMVSLVTRPLYCVIDGVDECVDECNNSIQKLLQLVLGLLNANANCRVVLLGRQHVLQPHVLQKTFATTPERIEISSDLVKQDINAFIGAEIEAKINSDLLRLPGLRDSISKTLQEKSDGMFLWVELMIRDLSKSGSQFKIKERLRNPPRSLEGIYRHLFLRLVKRLDKVQLNTARKLLAFTIISCRPLGINELQYAHALDSGSFGFKEHLLLRPAQSILDLCGDFINIKNDFVQLIHFSIQEFLTRPEDEWQHNEDREIICFRVDLEPSHRSLGSACLDYLATCECGYPLSDTGAFLKLANDYPFIRYASRHAISHLNQAGPLCSITARKLRDFLASKIFASWIENLAMLALEDGSLDMLGDEFERFTSRLDMGEYKRGLFETDLLVHMNQELERRIQTFGEHDPRTEQWQSLLHIIPLKGNVDDTDHNQTLRLPLTDESSLLRISNALMHNPTLPPHRQIDVLLRLESHLLRIKVLTDPLKMLFRIILQNSHAIPDYALVAVGNFYNGLGKWDEALEFYRRALAKVEGQERPIKFRVLSSIGHALRNQENYQGAEAQFRRCLEGQEQVLGKENRVTLQSAYWLVYSLGEQGRYKEAEGLSRQTLERREKTLGKEHKDTLASAFWLAKVLVGQERYKEAEGLLRQTLEIQGRTLGKEHKDTLWSAYWLAYVLGEQERHKDAEVLS